MRAALASTTPRPTGEWAAHARDMALLAKVLLSAPSPLPGGGVFGRPLLKVLGVVLGLREFLNLLKVGAVVSSGTAHLQVESGLN